VTLDDLRRVAAAHLDPARASTVVVCSRSSQEEAARHGLDAQAL
jgi:hypothetical protein